MTTFCNYFKRTTYCSFKLDGLFVCTFCEINFFNIIWSNWRVHNKVSLCTLHYEDGPRVSCTCPYRYFRGQNTHTHTLRMTEDAWPVERTHSQDDALNLLYGFGGPAPFIHGSSCRCPMATPSPSGGRWLWRPPPCLDSTGWPRLRAPWH